MKKLFFTFCMILFISCGKSQEHIEKQVIEKNKNINSVESATKKENENSMAEIKKDSLMFDDEIYSFVYATSNQKEYLRDFETLDNYKQMISIFKIPDNLTPKEFIANILGEHKKNYQNSPRSIELSKENPDTGEIESIIFTLTMNTDNVFEYNIWNIDFTKKEAVFLILRNYHDANNKKSLESSINWYNQVIRDKDKWMSKVINIHRITD